MSTDYTEPADEFVDVEESTESEAASELASDAGDDLFVDAPDADAEVSVDLSHFSFDGVEHVGSDTPAPVAPRFDGDTSELPASVCYALQELVTAAHVNGKSRNWRSIEANEGVLRSRLSELNLVLEIDHDRRYAFTRQISDADPRQRNILRSSTLTLAASVLALFLRQKYVTSVDDTPTVERGEMIDHLLTYKPVSDTDEAGFIRRVDAAINVLESRKVIRVVAGTDRYLVHGVIASLLTPDAIESYTRAYQALSGDGPSLTELDDEALDDGQVDTDNSVADEVADELADSEAEMSK